MIYFSLQKKLSLRTHRHTHRCMHTHINTYVYIYIYIYGGCAKSFPPFTARRAKLNIFAKAIHYNFLKTRKIIVTFSGFIKSVSVLLQQKYSAELFFLKESHNFLTDLHIYIYIYSLVWFLWVNWCQNHLCRRTVLVLFNP